VYGEYNYSLRPCLFSVWRLRFWRRTVWPLDDLHEVEVNAGKESIGRTIPSMFVVEDSDDREDSVGF
jgi:hypothetical protein